MYSYRGCDWIQQLGDCTIPKKTQKKKKNSSHNCPGLSMSAAELLFIVHKLVPQSVVNKNNTASNNKTKQQTNPCSSTCRRCYQLPQRKLHDTIMGSNKFVNYSWLPITRTLANSNLPVTNFTLDNSKFR